MGEKVNLIEYIHPKMDLFFVALNAPEQSNNNAHWFSNNLSFWNLLFRSGIIVSPIQNKLKGDEIVFGDTSINYNSLSIGVTDLNRRDVETNSNNVTVLSSDVKRILQILESNHVKKVCLMHSAVGRAFRNYAHGAMFNTKRYGKIGVYNNTEIYEVPFHTASIENKEEYYKQLIL